MLTKTQKKAHKRAKRVILLRNLKRKTLFGFTNKYWYPEVVMGLPLSTDDKGNE